MEATFPDHYRLKPEHVIREGDMELVQAIELSHADSSPGSRAEVDDLGRRMLRDGKGWQLKLVTRGYFDQKVEDTASGITMPKDVWRPRKTNLSCA